MSRKTALSLAMFVPVIGMVAGFLSGRPTPVPVVYAACGVLPNCGIDPTQTSELTVTHTSPSGGNDIPVEPDTGETWHITAYWSTTIGAPQGCSCLTPYQASVDATVSWDDEGGWSVDCTGCNPTVGPIRTVSICHVDGCGTEYIDNGWAYKLLVDVNHTGPTYTCPGGPTAPTYLTSVDYGTTEVDDGNLIDVGHCSESSAVEPDSQSWSDTDSGGFECGISCDYDGASVAITYQ